MPSLGTIKAHIKVDGQELPEYDIQIDQQEKSMTCWIPSEAGKIFSISWRNTDSSLDMQGDVILDGVDVGGSITRKGAQTGAEYDCRYTSSNTAQYFKFAPISYTDDDAYLGTAIPNTGEIRLTVWYTKIGETVTCSASAMESRAQKLHERSKKLGSHCVQLGDSERAPAMTFCKTTKLTILARFIFRYRPLEMLQAKGIAPLPPRPEPAENSRNKRKSSICDDDGDCPADGNVKERINKLKEELKRLESRHAKKKVKTEKMDRPLITNEVIDLT